MAQTEWLFEENSGGALGVGVPFAKIGSSVFNLLGKGIGSWSSVDPKQGSYFYLDGTNTSSVAHELTGPVNGGSYWVDHYIKVPATQEYQNYLDIGYASGFIYNYVSSSPNGSLSIRTVGAYNGWSEVSHASSSAGALPSGQWCRVRARIVDNNITEAQLFKGANIDGTTPDVSLTSNLGIYLSVTDVWYVGYNVSTTNFYGIDHLIVNDTGYPTRSTFNPAKSMQAAF